MHFNTLFYAASLLLSVTASPIEQRQSPQPVPPYVSQGTRIYSCTQPGTVALTFDDGITELTNAALNRLRSANMKATFFVNGENWGILRNHVPILQRMINQGHQVGSHTWNHPSLSSIPFDQVKSQMTRLEDEFLSLVGRYPTYMRPPYFDWNSNVERVTKGLKYRAIIADIDTKDYEKNVARSMSLFRQGLDQGGSIVLAHDVHDTTVYELLPQMIAELQRRGLRSVTVGECLGEHPNNWYRYSPR